MAQITVDGAAMEAAEGELLIAACERNGVHIPRFCYHRRMESVGMCRVCLVEVDTGRGPALQPSCMVPVSEGMKVDTCSEAARKAQNGVLEFLLINHPLDCPVCDKGGECPLQDQTMAYGPGETRFVEKKRNFEKPIPVSETVYLDRERCILCDRCTRFADQVSGDPLIHFMGRGAHSEVNVFPDEPFSSYFSGNTVQICPVGALTALPYRFKARPWDLTETISTAWVDSVGARVSVQASRDRVLRLLGVDSDAVNWGWLTDKERFAFEALNSEDRLRSPLARSPDEPAEAAEESTTAPAAEPDPPDPADAGLAPTSWKDALTRTADALADAPPERIGVLGGARLDNEGQYAWAKLVKGVLGCDNVDAQLGDGIDAELLLSLPRASIDDACRPGSTVLLLGPDPKEELGSLYLRLRHAVARDGVTLIEVVPRSTGLTGLAAHSLHPRPGGTATLVRSLSDAAERLAGADSVAGVSGEAIAAAARSLAAASGGVTVILGRPSLAEPAEGIGEAAAALRRLPSVRFLSALRRGNVHGALDIGLAPGLLPGRKRLPAAEAAPPGGNTPPGGEAAPPGETADTPTSGLSRWWPRLPEAVGLDARGILQAAADGRLDVLVLLGADPLNDFPDRGLARRGLRGAGLVAAVDMFVNDSAELAADVVLAAAGPAESEGTFTNLEGRVSRMGHKVTPPGTARPDWVIAAELAFRLGGGKGVDLGFDSPRAIRGELARASQAHSPLTEEALDADPLDGVLLNGALLSAASTAEPPEDRPSPESGSTALRLVAARTMHDDGVMQRHCAAIRGLARPAEARAHPAELERLGFADGADVRVSSDSGHLDAVLVADVGVPAGSLAVAWAAPGAPANTLLAADAAFTAVTVAER